jgi:hypothetical protein
MKRLLMITVLLGALHLVSAQTITQTCQAPASCSASNPVACSYMLSNATCVVTITGVPVPVTPAPSAAYVGPCDILAAAGTKCVAAQSLVRRSLANSAASPFEITRASDSKTLNVDTLSSGLVDAAAMNTFISGTTCTYTEFYDQMGTPALGNNLTRDVNVAGPGKAVAPCGWTTPPNGLTLPIARIVPGEGYNMGTCCNAGFSVPGNMPTGNAAITIYMVVENNSEGGSVNGCCSGLSDSESPTEDAGKGSMFGPSYATGGMCPSSTGTGTGPWAGVDLEDGNCLYGATPTAKYMTIIAKWNPTTSTLTLKSGDATQGALTTLYNGPLPNGVPILKLQGGYSLGRGGDGTNAPINFIEGGVIEGVTTDAADNALQANITSFYGPAQ